MARGKVPDRISKSAMTVDWHQDAGYTFYWYSALNTSAAQIEEYARSVVNTWVPITDTPLELGPVQLIRRRPLSLTRADLLCDGEGCSDGSNGGTQGRRRSLASAAKPPREYLRVSEIDDYVAAFPERVLTAEMRRGDVLFFDQFTYHRGLPNISPNMTRWSVDFRFQDARVPTLRAHPGYVLGSDRLALAAAEELDAPLIATDEDWRAARPAQRLSEVTKLPTNGADHSGHADAAAEAAATGGHQWAELHENAEALLGALQLERQRHRRVDSSSASDGELYFSDKSQRA